MKPITVQGFLLRLLFALLLVMLTYNPSGYSYSQWIEKSFSDFTPLLGLAGISLLISWVIYLRATFRSLGLIGLALATFFFAMILWLFIDLGWLGFNNATAMSWVVLLLLAFILAIGISWSHIRRKISGQVDSDDVGDE